MRDSWLLCFIICCVNNIFPNVKGFNTFELLAGIRNESNFDYLLLLKNHNASVSTNFTTTEDDSDLVRLLMEELELPVILLNENVSYFLNSKHSNHLLSVVHIAGEELDDYQGLLKALVANLRHMTLSRVLFLLELNQADELLLFRLFTYCWSQKLINVLAIFVDHQNTDAIYGYTHFPEFKIQQQLYAADMILFPPRLNNLQGFKLPVILGGTPPRLIAYYDKRGNIVYEGTVGHFMGAFQQKYNCTFVEPLPSNGTTFAPSTEIAAAVRNGSVEISLAITFPSIPMWGYTYPLEHLNWCLMIPVEADVPAAKYYLRVFDLKTFLLALFTIVLISLTLSATLHRFDYRVNLYEFVLHDSCLRGTLGQSFVEVLKAPALVRGIYLTICFLGIMLTCWYNSFFSAYVTSVPKELPYMSLDDVLNSNLKIVAWKPEYEELFGRLAQFNKYRPMFMVEPNFRRYLQLRESFDTKYGYLMPTTKWFIINEQQRVFTTPLFRMRDDFCFYNNVPVMFPVHENSIYMEPIQDLILDLSAQGLLTHWQQMGFTEQIEAGQLHPVDLSPRREFRALKWQDLQYIWYGYAFMVVLTTLILLLELTCFRLCRRIKK